MTKINLIFFLIIITRTLGYRIQTEIVCSQYANDDHILNLFPFTIHSNPAIVNARTTFTEKNKNKDVISMKIVSQKCIPSLIFCFKHLAELEIVNTSFCESKDRIPATIERLASSLTHLIIHDTPITHLPNEIGKLKRLQKLVLYNTTLQSLPDSIGDLFLLNILILSNNNLSSLSKTMINLWGLSQLTLTNNPRLQSIQSLNRHPSLRILDTRQCPIQLLPRNLPQLLFLYMSNNNLSHLNGIQSLGVATTDKKEFDFDGNILQFVSPRIRDVRHLHRLNLAHNQLQILPENIFNIPTLSILNIKGNRFLPDALLKYISKFSHTNPHLKLLHD